MEKLRLSRAVAAGAGAGAGERSEPAEPCVRTEPQLTVSVRQHDFWHRKKRGIKHLEIAVCHRPC